MDLIRFFVDLHAATHAADVSGHAGPERWLSGLSDDQMRRRPGAGLNSIVWLLWHMARTEDVAVNLVVAARAQVFDDAWARAMRIPRRDMGTGMTSDEVAELSECADVAAVRRYRSAVGVRTREVVQSLRPEAWDEILSVADTTRAASAGAFGPNDGWIEGVGHRPWQGHTRAHQLGQTAIRHNTAHIGEGVTVRGLPGFGLGV
jgi:DinB superfamily